MSRHVDIRPYAPLSGILGVHNVSTYDVTAVPGTIQTILAADPERLYAVIFFLLSGCVLSPFSDGTAYNLNSTESAPGRSVLLHHASYPGLVQRDWYGQWSAPGSCRVIDVSARG